MSKIRVLVYTDDETFVGQCLEHDLCVQAETLTEVLRLLEVQIAYYASKPEGLKQVPPAPEFFEGEWQTTDGDPIPMEIGATE